MAFIVKELLSWAKFVELFDTAFEPENWSPLKLPKYIFRGQADASRTLKPFLLRDMEGLNAFEALEIEEAALRAFRLHAHQHLDGTVLPAAADLRSWWSLMQHHGSPTRLLDWTASKYVAAYFAVDRYPHSAGVIWAIHTSTVRTHSGPIPRRPEWFNRLFRDPFADRRVYVLWPDSETARMAAQQTVFTVSANVLADHGEILGSLPQPAGEALFLKLIIPPSFKPLFLSRLRRMNITAQALFPGVDGLGRSVAELVYLSARHQSEIIGYDAEGNELRKGPIHHARELPAGDVSALIWLLAEQDVQPVDLAELERAMAEDPRAGRPLGPRVIAWIGTMVSKAASGAWPIGPISAAEVLTEALKAFYGPGERR